jgi:hypothetical protein
MAESSSSMERWLPPMGATLWYDPWFQESEDADVLLVTVYPRGR